MNNAVIWKDLKFKPMPASLVPAMRDAQLPTRVETARRALAACVDLSELLGWKDKAAAIAAAAKAAKMPDIARDARRLQKEAILRLGQLLAEYSNVPQPAKHGGKQKSERIRAAEKAGVSYQTVGQSVRLATAPKKVIAKIMDDDRIAPSPSAILRFTPPLPGNMKGHRTVKRSAAYNNVMSGVNEFGRREALGLTTGCAVIRKIELKTVRSLESDEKKLVRAKVTEIMELLDAIDEACK